MNGSQLTPTSVYRLSYQIPRIVIGSPSHNRPHSDGRLTITPGTFQPLELALEGAGNKPLNLVPFKVKFLVWNTHRIDTKEEVTLFNGDNSYDVICSLLGDVVDPYSGSAFAMLSDEQTLQIGNAAQNGSIRWGVFLINEDSQVFPMAVTSSGTTYGTIVLHSAGGTPTSSVVLGA